MLGKQARTEERRDLDVLCSPPSILEFLEADYQSFDSRKIHRNHPSRKGHCREEGKSNNVLGWTKQMISRKHGMQRELKSSEPRIRHIKWRRIAATPPIYQKLATISEDHEESKQTNELLLNTDCAGTVGSRPERVVPSKKNRSTIVILPLLDMEEGQKPQPKNQSSMRRRHMVILPQQNAIELRNFKMQDFMGNSK